MTVTVYPASKSKHAFIWKALRGAGVPLAGSWIDWIRNHDGLEPSPSEWARHWQRCLDESSAASIVLFLALEDERQCGALIEIGAALASGRQVYLVSPYPWSIQHHERVRIFPDLESAIGSIMATVAGETARRTKIEEAR